MFDTNNLKSNPVSVKITIELRNDQPPVFTAGGVYRYIEQQPTNAYPLVIGDNVTYTDADSGEDLQYSVTVSIANPIDVPYELLSANPPSAGISVVYHTVDVVYSTIETIEGLMLQTILLPHFLQETQLNRDLDSTLFRLFVSNTSKVILCQLAPGPVGVS